MDSIELRYLDELLDSLDDLNDWERGFVDGLKGRRGVDLTEKQADKLREIHERIFKERD